MYVIVSLPGTITFLIFGGFFQIIMGNDADLPKEFLFADEEILEQLQSLGFQNVTHEQLRIFKQGLFSRKCYRSLIQYYRRLFLCVYGFRVAQISATRRSNVVGF